MDPKVKEATAENPPLPLKQKDQTDASCSVLVPHQLTKISLFAIAFKYSAMSSFLYFRPKTTCNLLNAHL